MAAVEEAIATIPRVIEARRLFGDPDYLLRVVAVDLPTFQQLYDDRSRPCPAYTVSRRRSS